MKKKEPKHKTYDQLGQAAIIYMQALAGKKETPKTALTGWRSLDPHDREQTLLAYEAATGKGITSAGDEVP